MSLFVVGNNTTNRLLLRHSHFVEDVVISSDGQYALSASWGRFFFFFFEDRNVMMYSYFFKILDNTLRLWDLNFGTTRGRFVGHTKDVLSVAFSADNRQIVSGSRDKSIKLYERNSSVAVL